VQDQHFEIAMFQEAGEAVAAAMSSAGAVPLAQAVPLAVPFVVRAAHETPVFRAMMAVHFVK
jgi:hypothetical protein